MPVTIRTATAQDAESVEALGREFVAYLQSLGDAHPRILTAEEYLRDGFARQWYAIITGRTLQRRRGWETTEVVGLPG